MLDLVQHGNLVPGNILVNSTNLGRPLLLLLFLSRLRRAERAPESEDLVRWQQVQAALGGTIGAGVGIGLGTGTTGGQPLLGLMLGLLGGYVQRRNAPTYLPNQDS